MNKIGKFFGIGVGPGDPELLTLKAVRIIEQADCVFEAVSSKERKSIAGKIVSSIIDKTAVETVSLFFPMSKASPEKKRELLVENSLIIADKLKSGRDCVFITLGDPSIYSTCSSLVTELRKMINKLEVEIVPGITSFQAAAAKSTQPLVDDLETLLVVPAYKQELIKNNMIGHNQTIVTMKAYKTKNDIIKYAKDKNINDLLYVSQLGLDNEVISTDVDEIEKLPEKYLSLFILKK